MAATKETTEMKPSRLLIPILLMPWFLGTGAQLNAQIIVSMDPPLGAPGEQIILTGTGFAPGTLKVTFFNGVVDATAKATSATIIYAHVPAGASTGPITIQVGSGSPTTSVQDFQVVGFGPYISDLQPPYGAVNDSIVITGWHLTNATSVKFGGGKNSTNFMPNANGSQITAMVPSGATNGPITVTTTYGTSNSPISFTVIGAGPYVTGFFPAVGTAGDVISIFGVHLGTVTSASIGGQAAAFSQPPAESLVKIIAPASVVSGPIKVTSSAGSFTTATNFFVPPALTGFSPSSGRAGTNVNIRGKNLLGATSVTVDGAQATYFATNNTNLVMIAPLGAQSGTIRVYTPAGSAQSTSNFNFQPTITGFTPSGGGVGTPVAVSGANLNEGQPTVKFSGIAATVGSVTYGQVGTTVPAGAETGPITVTTTNGSFTTATNFFLPPVISSVAPSNGLAGTTVTIRGTNLLGTTSVNFNGKAAAFKPTTNNYVLYVTVPTNVLTGPVQVTNPGGTATSTGDFYGLPAITGFTPSHGIPGSTVTLSGTNFTGTLSVKFNGAAATDFTVINNGFGLVATVPTNATTGKIAVTAPAGTATSAANFSIDIESQLSVSIQATPNPAYATSNVVYQIVAVNAGPYDAPNTKVLNVLPNLMSLSSYTNSQGTVQVNGQQVTFSLGTLQSMKAATLQIKAVPHTTGTLVDTVSITSDYPDPDLSDNTNTASIFGLPLPLLSMEEYSASQQKISWSALLTNFSLQFDNRLKDGVSWSNLSTVPTIVGTNKFVIEPSTLPSRFYRLKQ